MKELKLRQYSSLEKVFLKNLPEAEEINNISVLKGDEVNYQIAYTLSETSNEPFEISVESEIAEYVSVRLVGNVPSELPAYEHDYDDDYITITPGLFPDVLYPLESNTIEAKFSRYHSLWITAKIPETAQKGDYDIKVSFKNDAFGICESCSMRVHIIDAVLPPQKLLYTQWIHPSAVADYYGLEMFSEEYWAMLAKFIKCAADNGVNMALVPIFGGHSRIIKDSDNYTFEFDNLERYICLCKECGIDNFEIGHLFAIKDRVSVGIECEENGAKKPLFGDSEYTFDKYKDFLRVFLLALADCLKNMGVYEKSCFHIGDEPTLEELDFYGEISEFVKGVLGDVDIMDALSDYEFYEKGYLNMPVVAIDHMKPYEGIPGVFGYNCCAQHTAVSNRFMAMPSYRNRIIGAQIYKYNLTGFLHWGFNWYYTEKNPHIVNPFLTTDGESTWQSGDPFSVYPGKDGPIESIRIKVFDEALADVRALQLLEKYIGRQAVIELIDKLAEMTVTYSDYPRTSEYLPKLREEVNKLIEIHSA